MVIFANIEEMENNIGKIYYDKDYTDVFYRLMKRDNKFYMKVVKRNEDNVHISAHFSDRLMLNRNYEFYCLYEGEPIKEDKFYIKQFDLEPNPIFL